MLERVSNGGLNCGRHPMAKNEKTSARIAKLAARALNKPKSLTKPEIRELAGAALTQAPDKKKKIRQKPK